MDIFKANNYEEIGGNSEFEIEVGEGIDAQGAKVEVKEEPAIENVGEGAHDIPTEEPIAEEPAVEEPTVDEPAVEEPVADEPAVEEPVADEPAVEEPVADEPDKEGGLTEKCALITIEPQPDGNIKTLNAQVHEATPAARAVAELESTQRNVFSKDKVAQLIDAISMEGERAFQSVGTLSNILNRAGKKLEPNANIIIEEAGEKTVYFTNGEMMKIDTNINDLGDMKFLLEAKNPEELKDTLDKIEARDNREMPREMQVEKETPTQDRGNEGMDIGDR